MFESETKEKIQTGLKLLKPKTNLGHNRDIQLA